MIDPFSISWSTGVKSKGFSCRCAAVCDCLLESFRRGAAKSIKNNIPAIIDNVPRTAALSTRSGGIESKAANSRPPAQQLIISYDVLWHELF